MAAPEYEPVQPQPEISPDIQHHQEDIVIPEYIEKTGIQAIPQYPASVQDDQGRVLAQSQSNTPPIQLPADPQTIHEWSKGSPSNSQTWMGVFWERVFKRAILFGRKVIVGNTSDA